MSDTQSMEPPVPGIVPPTTMPPVEAASTRPPAPPLPPEVRPEVRPAVRPQPPSVPALGSMTVKLPATDESRLQAAIQAATQQATPSPDAAKNPSAQPPRSTRFTIGAEKLKSSLIMVVDDEELNLVTVCGCLKRNGYHNFLALRDSRQALAAMKQRKPDCLLLDLHMPHLSGLDILRAKAIDDQLAHVPAIVLTAASDPAIRVQALELGATDFLTKPMDPSELIVRVRNALFAKAHIDHVTTQAAQLEATVERRTAELYHSRQQLILSLARAAEHRDNETSNHVVRVGRFAGLIAKELGWSQEQVQLLEQAAQLHDVGKIGIPDAILFKPGKLDPQEYAVIKDHCAIGLAILEPFSGREMELLRTHTRLGSDILHERTSPLMMMAARIAQTHHERWDGTGYPLGLAGEDIPIEGRITAVADVYDALSSPRPYKRAFPREKCFEILREGRGTAFDPRVLDAFLARSADIIQIQLQLMDREVKSLEGQ